MRGFDNRLSPYYPIFMNVEKQYARRGGFVLISTVAACASLIVLSGLLLMQTTQTRLALRKLGAENRLNMSMDTVLRNFSTMSVNNALSGGLLNAYTQTNQLGKLLGTAFPPDWLNNPNVLISIDVAPYPPGSAAVDLMNTPAVYYNLVAEPTRANLLPVNQGYIGRKWGYITGANVDIIDSLNGIIGSWYQPRRELNAKTQNKTSIGGINGGGAKSQFLVTRAVSNAITITEIPTQFSIQGENLNIAAGANQKNTIGISTGVPTIFGKNLSLSSANISIPSSTKIVAKARINNLGSQMSTLQSGAGGLGGEAVAGQNVLQELEGSGATCLVNVGTRGPEIFRSPGDYSKMIQDNQEVNLKGLAATVATTNGFLLYWLPYYSCNLRATVVMPNTTPVNNGAGNAGYSVSTVWVPDVTVPSKRGSTVPANTVFAGVNLNNVGTAMLSGALVLGQLDANGSHLPTPITVVSRLTTNVLATTPSFVYTLDVDLGGVLAGIPVSTAPTLGLYLDIRGNTAGADYIKDASAFPVIIRNAGVVDRPISIVTPGTVYITGPFATNTAIGGGGYPFSIIAPRVIYGSVGCTPRSVTLTGQRMNVGGALGASGAPLNITGAGGVAPPASENRLDNVSVPSTAPGAVSKQLPPVFLKDWLIESQGVF